MLNAQEQFAIGLHLERLALAHGWKKLDENGQLFFIEQMEGWHRSADDIIKAIKSLFDVPMTTLNLPRIREAVLAITPTNRLPESTDRRMTPEEEMQFHEAIQAIKIKTINRKASLSVGRWI